MSPTRPRPARALRTSHGTAIARARARASPGARGRRAATGRPRRVALSYRDYREPLVPKARKAAVAALTPPRGAGGRRPRFGSRRRLSGKSASATHFTPARAPSPSRTARVPGSKRERSEHKHHHPDVVVAAAREVDREERVPADERVGKCGNHPTSAATATSASILPPPRSGTRRRRPHRCRSSGRGLRRHR